MVDRLRIGLRRLRRVLADEPDTINSRFLQQFDEFNEFIGRRQSSPESVQPDSSLTPEQVLHASYQTLRNSLAADLLEQVKQASPAFFDHGVGVTTEATYELKRIDADYFLEE